MRIPRLEDIAIQLTIAGLYFISSYLIGNVFWPARAFQGALLVMILALIGYVILDSLNLQQAGPFVSVYISLGIALLTFGVIWLVVREILFIAGRWPLDYR